MVVIDLEKAFNYDRVPRQEVWKCLRELQDVPEKYMHFVKDTTYDEDARTVKHK